MQLEGIIYLPDNTGSFPGVVVCHPHPLYGGSMDNNIVNSLCESLTSASLISFKFNFRGVGDSQGSFDQGRGEEEDVKAAISFLMSLVEVNSNAIGLVGYSAGSAWGLSASCSDPRIKVLAAVSPPITMFDFKCIQDCPKPKLMISGDQDNFIPANPFLKFCRALPEPKECRLIEGADHFWWGFEDQISREVSAFFLKYFK